MPSCENSFHLLYRNTSIALLHAKVNRFSQEKARILPLFIMIKDRWLFPADNLFLHLFSDPLGNQV